MKKTICIILIVAFAALFGTSAYFIFDHYRQETKQAELYDSLADIVDSAAETEEEPAEPILFTEEKTVLPELAELYQQNGDLAGWIHIEDTNINYPVMHTPDNPDFYLKHSFEKEYSDYGCPYVQKNCDVQEPSDNVIIYGHHMKNGSMQSCDLVGAISVIVVVPGGTLKGNCSTTENRLFFKSTLFQRKPRTSFRRSP